jgi:pSer/pThr/pTyr-binding forkhead associated (FHA) protein
VDDNDPILLEIDKLIRLSRLKEIEFIMGTDRAERLREIRGALRRLRPGNYLLGTGPSTVGIIPLNGREVVLGRRPTVVEDPGESMPDYSATDTLYFVPREVSRAHARVTTQVVGADTQHVLVDLHSTCGTFINDAQVDPNGIGVILKHGDIISLGPSRTSTYVYYEMR